MDDGLSTTSSAPAQAFALTAENTIVRFRRPSAPKLATSKERRPTTNRLRPFPGPNTTVLTEFQVAFDLHDVLFTRDKTASAWHVPMVAFEYLKHPTFWFQMKSHKSFEDAYNSRHGEYEDKLEGLKQRSIDFANAQTPMKGMEELLSDLRQIGCVIYLFSNIGGIVLDDLKLKFPNIFTHFHGFHTPSQDNNYAKKPEPEAFRAFMDSYNSEGTTSVIFFDDKAKNIEEANKIGFIGHQFTSADDARQFLMQHGLLGTEASSAPVDE